MGFDANRYIPIFDIPEVLDIISQYLTPHDLAMAIATCKRLAQHMEPFLWRHLYVRGLPPPHESILRNRHFIRYLYISGADSEDLILLSNSLLMVTNHQGNQAVGTRPIDTSSIVHSTENSPVLVLSRMQRIKTDISGFDNLLLPIFNHCSNLTHLELSTFIVDDEGLFIDSLRNNLRQLLRLSIISFCTIIKGLRQAVRLESALPLLHVCLLHPQLRELDLAFEILSSKQPDPVQEEWKGRQYTSILEDLNNLSDSTGPFRSNITSLTLPTFYFGYPLSFLEPLLIDHVVNIERLTLPMIEINDGEFDKDDFNHDVEIEYYSRFCPKLQHLACIFSERNYNQKVIMAFIDRCGLGLKSCRIGFMNDRCYFDILQHLLYSYSDTLEEIDIYDCEMACSHSLQRVFSSCDKLRRFRLSLAPDGHVNMRIPELAAEEWACLEMRELHLKLSRDSVLNVELGQDSVFYDTSEAQARKIIENLYIQIGRLVKLEELYLNYSDRDNESDLQDHKDDLTLERGFLSQLKGLSMMWHFHMAMDLWSNMGRAEVEFIHANWTHLERISFGIPSYIGKDTIENKPHWRWLKKRRPTLSFEYKEYK